MRNEWFFFTLSLRSGVIDRIHLSTYSVGEIRFSWRCEYRLEVCTGSKLKPEPGPYPRLSDPTRPDPSGMVKFRARTRPESPPPPPPPQRIANKKKRKKAAFHDCMQRNRLIKALPFHKHLPVMKVCEHQRSHTFCRVYEFCMDKKIILPPYKLWSFFVS